MIREDRELLAELARLNTDMPSLALRMMDGSASVREQVTFTRLYLDRHDTILINNHDLTPASAPSSRPELPTRTHYRRSDTLSGWDNDTWNEQSWNNSRPLLTEGPALNDLADAELLAWALMDQPRHTRAIVDQARPTPMCPATRHGSNRAVDRRLSVRCDGPETFLWTVILTGVAVAPGIFLSRSERVPGYQT
ncbi:MAG: hypothetical protein ACRDTG_00110 [Pseudonocardiaceae bacterium]